MAEREVTGNDIFLFIGTTAEDLDTLVCLTTKSFNRTTETINSATQCGTSSGPGSKTADVSFEGVQMLDPDTNRISGYDLHDFWEESTKFYWKIAKAVPAEGDITYTGMGFLTSLSDTYGEGNATFSGTISVSGNITKSTEPES